MTELWKPVEGYEDVYLVSSLGRVQRIATGRILKGSPNKRGYLTVSLWENAERQTAYIHSLVATAFLGPRPPGREVNHKDGHKDNNVWDNLEYVTPKENIRHAYRMGLMDVFNPRLKLSAAY